VGLAEPFGEVLPLPVDLSQLGLDLRLRQAPIGRQVDEVLFAGIQRGEFVGELLV
jgi:hypothetical protein